MILKLKEARLLRGMTQEQVFILVDTSLRNYQRIEYGEVIPHVDVALQICKVLNVDPFDIEEWQTNYQPYGSQESTE